MVAGLLEIVRALGLKYSEGFTWPVPSVIVVVAGAVLLGIALLGEAATAARLACIVLIVAGVLGLKRVSGG